MKTNYFKSPIPTTPEEILGFEEKCRERLEGYWLAAGKEAAYPVGTAAAADLIRRGEYDLDPDALMALANEKAIPPVPRVNGKLAWSASNIITAICAAESRRLWKPFSTMHAHKFSMVEKLRHLCEREGECVFADLAQFDIPALLGILIQVSNDRGAVEMMAEAIRHKLQDMGVI